MTPSALIFDMDGIILDTEQLVRRCWNSIAKDYGLSDSDSIFLTTVGTTRKRTAEILQECYGMDFPAEQFNAQVSRLFHTIEAEEGIPIKTGVVPLLEWGKNQGLLIGLASSTRQVVIEKELARENLLHYFDMVIGGDQIARSKPYPDIYEAACGRLQAAPAYAYAIEDSYNGIRAAHAAGMHPIMIPDLLPPTAEMRQLCDYIFSDLTEFHLFLKENADNPPSDL